MEAAAEEVAPAGRSRLVPVGNVAMYLLAATYVVVALLTRQSGRSVTHTMWAEDGRIFLTGAYAGPAPEPWLDPYAGYLHLIPRLIAELATLLPVQRAALVLAVGSALVSAGCLVLLALGLKQWLPQVWMQAALVVALGSVRALGAEVDANVANLHWFVTVGIIGLILVPVRHWWTGAAAAGAMLLLGLTDYFAMPLAAVAVLVLAVRFRLDGRAALRAVPVTVAALLAAALQLETTLRSPRPIAPMQRYGPADTLSPYVSYVLRGHVESVRLSQRELLLHLGVVAVLLLVALVVRFVSPVRPGLLGRIEPSRLLVAVGLVVASPLAFAAAVVANQYLASRYTALPALLFVAALFVAAGGTRWTHRVLIGVLTAGLLASALLHWHVGWSARSTGPDWPAQVRVTQAACRTGTAPRTFISPPFKFKDGSFKWWAGVPCSELVP